MHDTCVKIKKNLPNRFHHIKPRVYTKSCAGFTTHCDIGALSQAIQHFSFDISWYADELSFDKTAEVRLLLDLAPCMWSGTIFSADCKTADFPIFRCLFVLPIVKKKKKKPLTMPRKLLCDAENVLFVFHALKKFSSLFTLWKLLCFLLPSHASCRSCLLFPNILPGVDPGFVGAWSLYNFGGLL